MKPIKIRIPATAANLGSGFDSFGVALNLYNEIEVIEIRGERTENRGQRSEVRIDIKGEGKDSLPGDEKNIVWKAMKKVFNKAGQRLKGKGQNLKIKLLNRIPMASGLGSSAAAVLGGLLVANKICYNKLSDDEILKLAVELEGHPDNIVPAFAGGLCICYSENGKTGYLKLKMTSDLKAVVCTPNFELSTKFARKILPQKLPMESAVFNLSRSAILVASILKQNYGLLKIGMDDRIHQIHRGRYIPGIKKVFEKAYKSGAYGVAISGSGPSIVSFSSAIKAKSVASAMEKGFKSTGVKCRSFILDFENKGAV